MSPSEKAIRVEQLNNEIQRVKSQLQLPLTPERKQQLENQLSTLEHEKDQLALDY